MMTRSGDPTAAMIDGRAGGALPCTSSAVNPLITVGRYEVYATLAEGGMGALALALAGCATPTAITVDIYTEVPCTKDAEVSITLADSLAALATSAPSSSGTGCRAGQAGAV